MKRLRLGAIAIFFAAAMSASYATPNGPRLTSSSTAQSGEQQIRRSFDTWLAAIRTGSSDAVMKLYTRDAILLPTLSPVVANTPKLRKAYFDVFTAKHNLKGKVDEDYIRVFGETAVNSGLYTFTYTDNKKLVTVP